MRAELGGKGDRIPEFALAGGDGVEEGGLNLAPLILMLEDGVDFIPSDYAAVGYTHYDVYCVGAAGGMGSNTLAGFNWLQTTTQEHVPDDIWYQMILANVRQSQQSGVWYYDYGGVVYWTWDLLDAMHPDHMLPVMTYHDPYAVEYLEVQYPYAGGGGPGGGGFQVVTGGALEDLPSAVPIHVGAPGADAFPGQYEINAPLNPIDSSYRQRWDDNGDAVHDSTMAIARFLNRYTDSGDEFLPPVSGGDGGYSAFGDICMASGGKGGGPSVVWHGDGQRYFQAHGGDGGKGGSIIAGGGGLGSKDSSVRVPGKDGVWDPVTKIGEGGGGGMGRIVYPRPHILYSAGGGG